MISVIVPVYNAEKYIKQTVEAIQNQDYQGLEILLINDGSKDNSLRICQEIARADDRVRVFDPVSYTHLDVYKRQHQDHALCCGCPGYSVFIQLLRFMDWTVRDPSGEDLLPDTCSLGKEWLPNMLMN